MDTFFTVISFYKGFFSLVAVHEGSYRMMFWDGENANAGVSSYKTKTGTRSKGAGEIDRDTLMKVKALIPVLLKEHKEEAGLTKVKELMGVTLAIDLNRDVKVQQADQGLDNEITF
jgi:hypothetical protein